MSTIVNIPAGAVSDFISATIAFLTSALPGWHFDVKTINTKSYSLPQHRERVFLCGARRDFFLAVPEDYVLRFAWFNYVCRGRTSNSGFDNVRAVTAAFPDNAANAYSVARAIPQEVFPCRSHREDGCVYTYWTSEEESQGIQDEDLREA